MEDDLLQEPEEDKPGREVIIMLAVFFEAGWHRFHSSWAGFSAILPWNTSSGAWNDAFLGVLATVPLVLMFLAMLRWPIGPLSKGSRSSATTRLFPS